MLGTRADVKKKEGRPPRTFVVGVRSELEALKEAGVKPLQYLRVFEGIADLPTQPIGKIPGYGFAKYLACIGNLLILACSKSDAQGVFEVGETILPLGANLTANYFFHESTDPIGAYARLEDGKYHIISATEVPELQAIDPETYVYGFTPSFQDIPKDGDMGVTLGQIDLVTGQTKKYLYIDADWVLLTKDILGARRTPYNVFGCFGSYIQGWSQWVRGRNYAGDPRFMRRDGVTLSPGEDSIPSNVPLIFRGGQRGKNFPQRLLKDHTHALPSHIRSLNGFYEHLGIFKLNAMPLGTIAYANISEMFEYLMPTYFCTAWKNPQSMYYPGMPAVCDSCRPVDADSAEYGVFMKTADKHECTTPSLVLNDIIWGPADNEGREFNLGLTTWMSLTHCAVPAFSPYFNSGAKWFPYEPCFTPINRTWARFYDSGWKPDDGPICIQCCDHINPIVTSFSPGVVQDFKRFRVADYSLIRAHNVAVPIIESTEVDDVDLSFAFAQLGVSFEDNIVAEGYVNEVNLLALYNKELTEVTSRFRYGFWGVDPADLYGPRWFDNTEYDPMVAARDVDLNMPITIEFSKPINRFSVVVDPLDPYWSFKVFKLDTNSNPLSLIEGSLEWTEDSMRVQFFPKFPWDASSTYLVRLEGCVIQDGPSTRLNTTTSLVYTDVLDNAYFNSEELHGQALTDSFGAYVPPTWPVLGGPLVRSGWSGLWEAYSAMHDHLDAVDAINDVLDNYNYAMETVTREGAFGNKLVGSIFPWGQWGVTNSPTGHFYVRPVYVPGSIMDATVEHPVYVPGALDASSIYLGEIWSDSQTPTRHIFDEKWGPEPDPSSNALMPMYPGADCTLGEDAEGNWGYPISPRDIGRFEFKFQTSEFIRSTKPIARDEHAPHGGVIRIEYLEPVHTEWLEANFEQIFQLLAFESEPDESQYTAETFEEPEIPTMTLPDGEDPYQEVESEEGFYVNYEQVYSGKERVRLNLVVNTPLYTLLEVANISYGVENPSYRRRLYGNRWHCLRINKDYLMKKTSPPAVAERGEEAGPEYELALERDYFVPFRTSPFFVGTWPPDNAQLVSTNTKIAIAFNHGVNPETVTLRSALGEGNPMGTRESGELIEIGIMTSSSDSSSFLLSEVKNIDLSGNMSSYKTQVFVTGLAINTGPFDAEFSFLGDKYRVTFIGGLPEGIPLLGEKVFDRIYDFKGERTYYPQLGMWGDDERVLESEAFVPKYNVIIYDQSLPIFGSTGRGGYNVYLRNQALQSHEYRIATLDELGKGYLFIYDFQKADMAFRAIFSFPLNQTRPEVTLTLVTHVENDFIDSLTPRGLGEKFTWDPYNVAGYSMVYNAIPYPWDGDIRGWDAKILNKETGELEYANIFAIDGEVFTFAGQDSTDVILYKPYNWKPQDWMLRPASVAVYKCEPDKYNGSYGLFDQSQLMPGVISFAQEQDDAAIFNQGSIPNYYFSEDENGAPRVENGIVYNRLVPTLGEITRIIFTPYRKQGTDPFEENSTYAIVVGNDIEGIYGASPRDPFRLTYDSISYFTTGGIIESTVPVNDSIDVNPYTKIEIYFGTSVYPDSLNENTVILKDDAMEYVAFDATFLPEIECLVITPEKALLSNMRYYCTLTTGVVSDCNRRFHLNANYTFSFLVTEGHAIDMEIL